jgi:general secretion pathway protein D
VSVTKIIPDDRTNKLIVIADEKSFERIVELVQQLDVPASEAGGIHVVFLKNASAEDLAGTLSNLAQGKSGQSGSGSAAIPAAVPGPAGRPATAAGTAGGGGSVTAELFTGDVKITADKAQNALVIQAGGADIVTVRRLIEKLDRPRRQVFVEAVIMEVNINDSNSFGVGMHGAVPVSTKDGTGFVPIGISPGRISTIGPLANVQSLVSLGGFLTGYSGPV